MLRMDSKVRYSYDLTDVFFFAPNEFRVNKRFHTFSTLEHVMKLIFSSYVVLAFINTILLQLPDSEQCRRIVYY